MARISLRAYNRDIETLIDQNQIDEAIAHCRHILGRYPKHLATYRLMGKALLETQRFGDASDVFHRVLSSVPDDFIAHLGMSIIREDEGNLDGAIWHMERAFEVQPSNAAIQDELRRLYRLRDGLTPQKIQLTRGALARMSAKSNLYSQAIAELRSALTDDPQRPDLLVLLAAMYAQTGARIEAIEICNALVSKLPYCLEANRLLFEQLSETERAKEAQVSKQRLNELDPYFAHMSPVATTVDLVPDSAVTIERFEYQGEVVSPQEPTQPGWATTLGVTLEEDSESLEEAPEWLSPAPDEEPMVGEIEELEELDASQKTAEREAIMEEDTDLMPPEPPEFEELPEWMEDTELHPTMGTEAEAGEETPEWLLTVMEEPSEEAEAESVAEIEKEAFSDTEIVAEESEDEEPSIVAHPGETAGAEGTHIGSIIAGAAVAELVGEKDSEDEEIQEPELSQIEHDILSDDQSHEIEESSDDDSSEEQVPELSSDGGSMIPDEEELGIPDWLQGLGEGIPEEEVPETVSEPVSLLDEQSDIDVQIEPEASIIDESDRKVGEEEFPESIPEWLSTISPRETPDLALTEDLVTSISGEEQEIVRAEIPVWLRKMEQEHMAEMQAVKESESLEALDFDSDLTDLTGDDVPSWLISAMEGSMVVEALEYESTEDVEEILAGLAEAEAVVSEPAGKEELIEEALLEGDTQPVVVGDQIGVTVPETRFEPEEEATPITPEIEAAEIEEIPELLTEVEEEISEEAEVALPTGEDEDAAMAWLESLAVRQGVAEEELLTSPEERLEEPPEWIQETVLDKEVAPEEEVVEGIEGIAAAAIAGYAIGEALGSEEEEGEQIAEEEEAPTLEAPEWVPEAISEEEEPTEIEGIEILPVTEEALGVEEIPAEITEEIQPSEALEQPVKGFPEWLSGMAPEEEVSLEEPSLDWAPSIITEEITTPEEVYEELVSTKVDLNAASLAQLEKIPGIGFILAQNIVSYRDSVGPFQSVDELENVPELPPEIVDDLKNYLTVEVVSEVSTPVSTHPDLQEAWNSFESGDISSAVDQYSQLIKRDEHLDEIIRDLQEALSKYPVDASLYQTLGDAYLRTNMLQEALDAYNRAEDLIK